MASPLHHLAHRSARKFLNLRLGWQLMRDRNVPAAKKVAALIVGIGITGILIVLEVPLEGVLALVVPFLGFAADALIDGAELVMLPLLIALAILPYLHREPVAVHADIEVR